MLKANIAPGLLKTLIPSLPLGSYVTGSFIIGGATFGSDIDIVVPITEIISNASLNELAGSCGTVEYSLYNNGRKVRIVGCTTINILQLHPLEYAAFLFATDTMRRSPIVTDRNARHRCFEELCHAYKSFINPTCVTIDAMTTVYTSHANASYMANLIDWEHFYARQL